MAALVTIGGMTAAQMWVDYPTCGQLTTGTKQKVVALWCHSAGEVTVTFASGQEESRTYADGDMVAFPQPATVAIVSGTFSVMVD
jgi:hypothetical protein